MLEVQLPERPCYWRGRLGSCTHWQWVPFGRWVHFFNGVLDICQSNILRGLCTEGFLGPLMQKFMWCWGCSPLISVVVFSVLDYHSYVGFFCGVVMCGTSCTFAFFSKLVWRTTNGRLSSIGAETISRVLNEEGASAAWCLMPAQCTPSKSKLNRRNNKRAKRKVASAWERIHCN